MAFRARLDSTLGLPGLPGGGQAGAKQPFQPPPPAPFGQLSGPAETVALAGLQAEGSEDLITPANAEAGPAALNPLAAVPATATAWALAGGRPPAPPPPQQCLLCGGLGSSSLCGVLKPAIFEGRAEAVHHLCALWAPGCFQREGSSVYVNLEEEARRARTRTCTACGQAGASLVCAQPGCRAAFHLPCGAAAPGVVLEGETYEVWCAAHAGSDNSDEDYSFHAPRPRRQTGGGGSAGKRPRTSSDVQRPRTDWQKRDDHAWLKVVPPWWCEHRTVHFASKVFKELFRSAGSAVLVDPAGGEWVCVVQSEARNDLRPQYTLRGAFAELWQAQGIGAGDTLVFKRDPLTAHIELSRIAAGSGAAAAARLEEQGAASDLSEPSGAAEGGGPRGGRPGGGREASSEATRGPSTQGSHPNRWMELTDGWAIKTVYKSTLQHQQCPIAGWLFKKLYGRLPGDSDRAPVYDPDLEAEFRFDVSFIAAANVHYMTGRTFSGWVRESGLRAGEQIRMRCEGSRVLIQRVPADCKITVDHTTKAASRSVSLGGGSEMAVAGAPAGAGMELASPPPADALEALDALVAAAGYAGQHGTPAIQAALAGAAGAAAAAAIVAAGLPGVDAMLLGADTGMPPQLKRRRGGQELDGAAEMLLHQQEQQVLLARRSSGAPAWPAPAFPLRPGEAAAAAPATLEGWQPSHPHVLMLRAINQALAAHEWSPEDQADCLCFRAKYAWLDACGREMVYEEVQRLAGDKPALLTFLRAVAQGILTPVMGTPAGAAPPVATSPVPVRHGGGGAAAGGRRDRRCACCAARRQGRAGGARVWQWPWDGAGGGPQLLPGPAAACGQRRPTAAPRWHAKPAGRAGSVTL